ncbi:MAG: hypothetical protein JF607_18650 [Burkholderiales bacterium]|jgi:uncharacterized protein YkwD|nr:hypothetical protein [Burkholderiales bacterium]
MMKRLPYLLLAGLCLWADLAVSGPGCQPAHDEALRAINQLRSEPRVCGPAAAPAAVALAWDERLATVAAHHAQELAGRDRLDHVGASGATLRTRLRGAGYLMRVAGENLAGGPETLEKALAQWLASPAHCENLMGPEFQQVGLACVAGPGLLQRYWVLELAAPAAARASPRSNPDQSP